VVATVDLLVLTDSHDSEPIVKFLIVGAHSDGLRWLATDREVSRPVVTSVCHRGQDHRFLRRQSAGRIVPSPPPRRLVAQERERYG
jgi:hypothetical protein